MDLTLSLIWPYLLTLILGIILFIIIFSPWRRALALLRSLFEKLIHELHGLAEEALLYGYHLFTGEERPILVDEDNLQPPDECEDENADDNQEELAVNLEEVVWIEGREILGNGLYAPGTTDTKMQHFTALQENSPLNRYNIIDVKDFIVDALEEIWELSLEERLEDRIKLIRFLKHASSLNSHMDLPWREHEPLRLSFINLIDSWKKASKRILHQPEMKDKIFGFLQRASNIAAEGCLITTVSDMPENYKRISSHWKSGRNWEKQLRQCILSNIKSQITGKIDVSHMNEAEELLGDLVNLTPIYLIGKVENLLDGSPDKGFLMFTTPLEIDAKTLRKVDTNQLLSAIDQRGKAMNPAILERLILKEDKLVADISLILDESVSICEPNFVTLRNFLADLVEKYPVSPTGVRFSAMTFARGAWNLFDFDTYESADEVATKVRSIKKKDDERGGATYTHLALKRFRDHFYPTMRKDVSGIVILVTDGGSTEPKKTEEEAQLMKQLSNVTVFVVGISDSVNHTENKRLASDPDDKHYFQIDNYEKLNDYLLQNLKTATCNVPRDEPKDQSSVKKVGIGRRGDYTVTV